MTDRMMLLDTASLYFRAFFGVPDSIVSPDGTPVNAVRGLGDMIARLTTDYEATHLVACWDDDWRPAWRVERIPSYKAHRVVEAVPGGVDVEETPPGLVAQIPRIRELLDVLGIAVVGAPEAEADDVIGTLATGAPMPVDIVTGDRDLFQLVDDAAGVRLINTARGMSKLEVVTEATVVGKYGVLPQQYADFATLRGDASDGLPGVAGVGEKTAAGLLQTFGTLDGVLAAAEAGEPGMSAGVRAKLAAAADYLALAPEVVRVRRELPLGFEPGAAKLRPLDAAARERLEQLGAEWNLGGTVGRLEAALDRTA